MKNKDYLVSKIKEMLERDDLADNQRIRLLGLLAKFVPPAKRRKRKAKPAPAKPASAKPGPFQRPAWFDHQK